MSKQLRVSLVTPAFNSGATIKDTVRSVEEQQFNHLEHIVIDGGSTDDTCEILARSPTVTSWSSEPDEGIADAFNKGIRRCSGELIGIINSDDFYASNAISIIWDAYSSLAPGRREQTVLHGDICVIRSGEANRRLRPRLRGSGRWHWSFYFEMPVHHPTCFVPKQLYERVGTYRTDFRVAMDFEWILRAWRQGARFHYLPRLIVNFRAGGLSGQNTRLALDEVYRAQRLHSLPRLTTKAAFLGKSVVNRLKVLNSR